MSKKDNRRMESVMFEMILLGFFELWRQAVKQHRDTLELEHTHWLEDFCSYVWESLEKFEDAGMLKEPLRPQ